MADTNIETAPVGTLETHGASGLWGPFWTDDQNGAIVFINTNRDITARRTTNGGTSWGAQAVGETLTSQISLSCWFDRQTPNDTTGTKIHCCYGDDGSNSIRYAAYDISTDTWSTPVQVDTPGTIDSANSAYSFVVKSRDGQIVIGQVLSTVSSGAYKAASPYTSWSATANPFESNAVDQVWGVCGNTSDPKDIGIFFWDVSANQISIKMYDDSANTWTETLITGTGFTESAAFKQMGTTMRLSDGHAIMAAWNAFDVSTADMDVFDVNPTTIATVSFSTLTQPITNQDNSAMVQPFINQQNNHIYVIYGEGTNPTSDLHIKWKRSTDNGSSWEAAVTYSDGTQDDYRLIGPTAMAAASGRLQPCWFDDDDVDLFINLDNDVPFPAAAAALTWRNIFVVPSVAAHQSYNW